ncbi:MAG: peptide chain release factor N(5)-glutamine methyltransferase [Tenericutes bacterium]|nr:peptide chain release factor N(5)-glutamine methyltransferase [Mycoplasmatota bacterium]
MRNKPENISNLDWNLLCQKYDNLEEVIAKIDEGYPIAYLIGDVSFYGYPFKVNENVLIPRFETETLIEKTIKLIKSLNLENSNLIDLGTGSGVIAITLKKEIPSLNITAIDKSKESLKVAIENSKLNNVNVDFQNQDIFNYELPENISIVISNPPYIEEDSNYSQNVLYEPKEAIFVSNINPLIYYEQILKIAKEQITKKHLIAFEIDEDHKEDMHKLCKKYFPSDNIVIEKDLAGKNRYAFIYSE